MEILEVVPWVGIGAVRLGMGRGAVERHTNPTGREGDEGDGSAVLVRYPDFHVTYRQGVAAEILLCETERYQPMFCGLDLLHTGAETLIPKLGGMAAWVCDCTDPELACTYEFPQWGLSLWRESAFHPKLLATPYYGTLPPEQRQDETRFSCFAAVRIRAKSEGTIPPEQYPPQDYSTPWSPAPIHLAPPQQIQHLSQKYGLQKP